MCILSGHQALTQLASDREIEILRRVCQAFTILISIHPEVLQNQITNIINFMMYATAHNNEHVSTQACEFWIAYVETDGTDFVALEASFPNLIPLLVRSMRYSDEELAFLYVEDDASVADKASVCAHVFVIPHSGSRWPYQCVVRQDIKPVFHHSREAGSTNDDDGAANGDDLDFADDMDEEVQEWTLRKSAGSSLDFIAMAFQDAVLRRTLIILFLKDP